MIGSFPFYLSIIITNYDKNGSLLLFKKNPNYLPSCKEMPFKPLFFKILRKKKVFENSILAKE
jgi:hypothetical protein